ncbi:hypothetical protein ACFPN2_19230 [Steroidobacter flavus]|uniref:Uncharacterized protein n=1 Tax=Steroidobacter flavus TaxID=1842136 RepID=A0ABV8SVP5_9GAMM
MNAKLGSTIVVLFALALSLQTVAKDEKSRVQQEFEEDPTNLAIDSGRWSALIERSNSGLDLLERPAGDRPIDHAAYLFRADVAQKGAALDLLLLRNRLLAMELVKPSDLRSATVPDWIFEPPTSKVSADTLTARLDWIAVEANELVEVGCNIGRQKTDEALFCSVE